MRKLFVFALIGISINTSAQRYVRIHKKAIVADTHNDILYKAVDSSLKIDSDLSSKTHSDLNRLQKGGIDVQIFSVWADSMHRFARANKLIDTLYAVVNRNQDKMQIIHSPSDLHSAIKQNKLAAMMGVEGGHMIDDKLENIDSLYRRGVRYMTLTWNNSTSWATSAMDETKKKDSILRGLNEFGKAVVKRMNQLGMMVDLSHVGERTFWDAINTSTKPVIVSHSDCHSLCPVFRNLKDEQVKAVGKNGGVICLNFYSGFLDSTYDKRRKAFTDKYKREADSLKRLKWNEDMIDHFFDGKYKTEKEALRPPLEILLDHLDHIVKLAGVDHVGLGSDFDGISSTPEGLDDVTSFPLITKALLKRGYSKKNVRKILGGNVLRVYLANDTK